MKDLKSKIDEYLKLTNEVTKICKDRFNGKGKFKKFYDEQKAQAEAEGKRFVYDPCALYKLGEELISDKRERADKLYNEIIKEKVEIKEPEKIFAARATTGYAGKLDFVECDNLVNLTLSGVKEEGNITTPFFIDIEGNAEYQANSQREYRIKRKDGKVYILLKSTCLDVFEKEQEN